MPEYIFIRDRRDFYKIEADTAEDAEDKLNSSIGRLERYYDHTEYGDIVFWGTPNE